MLISKALQVVYKLKIPTYLTRYFALLAQKLQQFLPKKKKKTVTTFSKGTAHRRKIHKLKSIYIQMVWFGNYEPS